LQQAAIVGLLDLLIDTGSGVRWDTRYYMVIRLWRKNRKKVNHFSYPFGTYNEVGKREIEFVKKCGFDTACYSFGGDVNTKNINKLHEQPRVFFGELHR
jgi:hypothetical protein